jgi:hypothetical protein
MKLPAWYHIWKQMSQGKPWDKDCRWSSQECQKRKRQCTPPTATWTGQTVPASTAEVIDKHMAARPQINATKWLKDCWNRSNPNGTQTPNHQ